MVNSQQNKTKNKNAPKITCLLTIFAEPGIMAHMMAKPMEILELHYLMIQFLIITKYKFHRNKIPNCSKSAKRITTIITSLLIVKILKKLGQALKS